MHRLFFYGIMIAVIVIIGLIIDQVFWRLVRLVAERHLAMQIRLWALGVTTVTLVCSCLYGHYVTRLQVETRHVDLPLTRLPEAFDGFRMAHISDFHIDSFDSIEGCAFIEQLGDAIAAEHPDIVCFTGDMVTQESCQLQPFLDALDKMTQRVGVPFYTIMGNHDYADYSHHFTKRQRLADRAVLCQMQKGLGWHMLRNTSLLIGRDGQALSTDSSAATAADSAQAQTPHLLLVGVENIGEPPFTTYGDLGAAMRPFGGIQAADTTCTLLLSHNPTHWRQEVLCRTHIDLTLSGHTHAFQLRILGWSPVSWKYDEWGGLYSQAGQHLYVNTGLGCTGPRIRIGVAPEVTILTLRRP